MDSIDNRHQVNEALPHQASDTQRFELRDQLSGVARARLIGELQQQANSEYVAMLVEGPWIARAPTLQRKALLLTKMNVKATHALALYSALAALGISGEQSFRQWLDGTARYLDVFNYPALSWADIGVIGWLVGAAEIAKPVTPLHGLDQSYARRFALIGQEKRFHHRQDFDLVMKLTRGTQAQRRMAQDALDRWWWPTLMMFGPPEGDTQRETHQNDRARSNDTLRQKFIDETVPQVRFLGLSVPDDNLCLNRESGHYEIGQIDWETFERVSRRGGICNRARVEARRKAWQSGAWVRDAAAAYAAKLEVAEQGSL